MRIYISIFFSLICISFITAQNITFQNKDGKISKNDSVRISESLFEEGMKLYKQKEYQSAIQKFNEVVEIDSLLYLETTLQGLFSPGFLKKNRKYKEQYARMWIGSCLHHLGKDSIAQQKNKWYLFEPYDRKRVIISDSLMMKYNTVDISIANKELYLQRILLATTLDSIEFGKYSPRYLESLGYLSSAYNASREFDKQLKVLFKMKDIGEYLLHESSPIYHSIIGNIGITYNTLWQHYASIKYLEKYFSLTNKYKTSISRFFYYNPELIALSNSYIHTKQYEKAFSIMIKQVEEKQAIANHNKEKTATADFIQAKKDFAHILDEANYTKEALREYLEVSKIMPFPDEYIYNDIASCFLKINDTKNARIYLDKAQKVLNQYSPFMKRIKGEKDLYTEELLARTEVQEGNIEKAIDLLDQLIETFEQKSNDSQKYFFNKFHKYQDLVSTRCHLYIINNQYEEAIVGEKSNLKFKQKYYKVNSPIMGESYFNIGEAYAGKREYKKALKYTKKAYQLRKDYFTNNDGILMNLIRFHIQIGDKKSAESYLDILYSLKRKQILYYFSVLTEREKQLYWNMNHFFFTEFVPKYAALIGSNKANEILYNSILDTKGILLDSEKVLRRGILDSGDSQLQEFYFAIQEKKQIVLNELSKNEDVQNRSVIDSLANLINDLEDELIINSKEFRDFTMWKRCNWKEIQNKIAQKDIAIEFLTLKGHKEKEYFAALVIKKNAPAPKLIKLCKKEYIISQYNNGQHNLREIDKMIWKPLVKELEDIDRIYFSPSDFLYNYGIEYAEEVQDKKVYRLSTTKELVTPKRKKENKIDALLVGGLNYNSKIKNPENKDKNPQEFESMRDFDNNELRGFFFNNLPYSRKEIFDIERILSKEKNCVLLSDNEGTEEAVMYYSSLSPRIIHIATHGAYIPKKDCRVLIKGAISHSNNTFLNILPEEVSLTRSFLLMSGCNSLINSNNIVNQQKDGILTAQEIAQLDLRGSELISLSACQTGLGDITHDGVIGLQRGFKRAGAQSLIMSLTKVNDRTTYEFMENFYKEYITSNEIKSAFNHSIKIMKAKYPTNPKYWRAFILMDALK